MIDPWEIWTARSRETLGQAMSGFTNLCRRSGYDIQIRRTGTAVKHLVIDMENPQALTAPVAVDVPGQLLHLSIPTDLSATERQALIGQAVTILGPLAIATESPTAPLD